MKTFVFVAFICIFGSLSDAFPDKRNVVTDDETILLRFCAVAMGIEECADRFGLNLPLSEVFRLMTLDPAWVTASCHEDNMEMCLSSCDRQFKASKFGYMRSICSQRETLVRHRQCWDDAFPEQASRCVARYYPDERWEAFYPTPYRVYNQTTIARDCFPGGPPACQTVKANVVYHLMPQYYEIFPRPV